MFDLVSKIWSNEEKEQNPQVDVHQDENAEIGDIRYIIKTEGQIFGYEKDRNKINLVKQVYTEGGSFHDGRKIFKWRRKKKVFRGTIKGYN